MHLTSNVVDKRAPPQNSRGVPPSDACVALVICDGFVSRCTGLCAYEAKPDDSMDDARRAQSHAMMMAALNASKELMRTV